MEDFEKALDVARREWLKQEWKKITGYNTPPSEHELQTIGRVAWDGGAHWAREWFALYLPTHRKFDIVANYYEFLEENERLKDRNAELVEALKLCKSAVEHWQDGNSFDWSNYEQNMLDQALKNNQGGE